MSDIVNELRDYRCGIANSDVSALDALVSVPIGLLMRAADEIERLRYIAGAVTPGQSVADIKELLRTPEGIAKLNARLHGERTTS